MKIIAIIPARMASTRFPGKPLAPICGLPMVIHVLRRTRLSPVPAEVYVATPDREIAAVVERHGGTPIMTADTHTRCTERIAEAAADLDAHIVVNVQGDEPLLHPDIIELATRPMLEDPSLLCVNPLSTIEDEATYRNPNVVKAVCDQRGFVLYFSREPIPTRHFKSRRAPVLKQLPIIPFRRDFLMKFTALAATPLEMDESVDMMRVLEHGFPIKAVHSPWDTFGVDTPPDLERAEQLMRRDAVFPTYA